MAEALRAVTAPRGTLWLLPAAAFLVPLVASLWLGVGQSIDAAAWSRLWQDSQFGWALLSSLWIGLASTLLALAATIAIVARLHGSAAWPRLRAALGPALAVPHAAFAIGLALLLVPSGLPARLVAVVAGWSSPPDIATVQDPWGLGLIAGLALKEVPFLLWNVAAQLQRVGHGAELERQLQIAATMGYTRRAAWSRLLWPQLLPRLALPLLAVLAYGLTVVDMALVLGPTRPPTLAVLAWQWLLDADPAMNHQGAAAALLLTGLVLAFAGTAVLAWRALRPVAARRWTRGDRPAARSTRPVPWLGFGVAVYVAVLLMLVWMSVVGVWRFPQVWPAQWTLHAWTDTLSSVDSVRLTAQLALAASTTGLVLAVAWMETTPAAWDARAAAAVFAPMLVPGVLLVAGLYQLSLHAGLDGRFAGVWLAHSLYAAPYVLVALSPAYRGFDPRYAQTAQALGRERGAFLLRIKWPMLLAPIAAAWAIGFAVSVTQYLPTQFVGAGRYATVTTEALTLASGGQRSVAAAFALLQGLLPAAAFIAAWWIGRWQARRLGAVSA
jgi:putative thiamine transport system permease protein